MPERVRTWAQAQVDREIVAVEALGGGRTDTISALYFRHGEPLILRWVPIARWGETGRRHIHSEAGACRLLTGSSLPVARLVASDPDGEATGAYVNLTTWLPGTVRLEPLGPGAVDELARVAAVIHAVPVDAGDRPWSYAFWAPVDPAVPAWAHRPELWARAIQIFRAGPPTTPDVLLHRDFHPGNILWRGDRITGVIDWAESSWGPADLDVAHAATNLALLHDPERAAAFRSGYRHHGGRLAGDPEAARYWVVSDLLGFLPDPVEILAALTWTRPDLGVDVVRGRLERLLELTLTTR